MVFTTAEMTMKGLGTKSRGKTALSKGRKIFSKAGVKSYSTMMISGCSTSTEEATLEKVNKYPTHMATTTTSSDTGTRRPAI